MAQGEIKVFHQFKEDVGGKLHDLNTDDMYYVLNTSTLNSGTWGTMDALSDPRYGTGGGTNLTTTECTATTGNYSAGGANIAPTDAWARSAGTCTFTLSTITITQDTSLNPTDARFLNVYNWTDTGKRAVVALDLGAVTDMTTGDFSVTWNGSGVFTLA